MINRLIRSNFDTYKLVRQLERQGLTRGQAVAVMTMVNSILHDSSMTIKNQMISRTDMENESFIYKSQLAEFRNELDIIRQNDTSLLKNESDQTLRSIEHLSSKFSEALSTLKSEISIELNNCKAEGREMSKNIDLRVQEIQHEQILKLSQVRISIEAMKMKTTRSIVCKGLKILNAVGLAIGTFASLIFLEWWIPIKKKERENSKLIIPFPLNGVMPSTDIKK